MHAKKQFIVVAYDISNNKRRNRIAKILESKGNRVNFSVFECMISIAELEQLYLKISKELKESADHVIYYKICVNCFTKIVRQPNRNKKVEAIEMISEIF